MILETKRLILRKIRIEDATFYFNLFNDPDWIKFINDKQLKSIQDTAVYLKEVLIPKLCINGLGLFTVFEKSTNKPIGTSSVLKRENLECIDIGYGFLPIGRRKGYATEATKRIMEYVNEDLKQKIVYAFTKPNNINSQKLLRKIGFNYKGLKPILSKENNSIFEYSF